MANGIFYKGLITWVWGMSFDLIWIFFNLQFDYQHNKKMCFSVYRVTTERNRLKMNALYQESYFFLTLTHSSVLQWYVFKCAFM